MGANVEYRPGEIFEAILEYRHLPLNPYEPIASYIREIKGNKINIKDEFPCVTIRVPPAHTTNPEYLFFLQKPEHVIMETWTLPKWNKMHVTFYRVIRPDPVLVLRADCQAGLLPIEIDESAFINTKKDYHFSQHPAFIKKPYTFLQQGNEEDDIDLITDRF